jgi:hypothetical protein
LTRLRVESAAVHSAPSTLSQKDIIKKRGMEKRRKIREGQGKE